MALPPHKAPHLTPKHLVGLERDRFYNRILVIATLAIVGAVVALVAWGIYQKNVLFPRQPVAIVEGAPILGSEFQTRVRVNRNQLVNNYMQYVYTVQAFGGGDQAFQQQAYSAMSQIQYELQPEIAGNSTINEMVDDKLLALEAQELGITVSDAELDNEIKGYLNYYPNGTPTSVPTSTPFTVSTLSATQLAFVTLTPTPSPLPSATPTIAIPTPTSAGTAFPTSTSFPSPTPYTAEGYDQALSEYFATLNKELGLTQQDIRDVLRSNLLRRALYDEVTGNVARYEDQVWARHILVDTQELAQEVLDKLAAGEDWSALAAQYSTDTGNKDLGGDLGWFNKETMVAEFAEAAFALRVGETSAPIQSQFGWHIIQSLGHERRPLDDAQYEQARQLKFQEFIAGLREKYEWEIYDNWSAMTPEEPSVPLQYRLQQ